VITFSKIAVGDQLGAQMVSFAKLYYIARENNQEIAFFKELMDYKRGYLFLKMFELSGYVRMIGRDSFCTEVYHFLMKPSGRNNGVSLKNKIGKKLDKYYYRHVMRRHKDWVRLDDLKNGQYFDPDVLTLCQDKNYDISTGFGSCMEWNKYEPDLKKMFRFRSDIVEKGEHIRNEMIRTDKPTCSVHFRRTDYLLVASLNLSEKYYEQAIHMFDTDNTCFVVFSDDIEAVKELSCLKGLDVVFMPQNPGIIDMYLMSRCDHNIIANSTFSFWGAYLNENRNKKVICPHDFIGSTDMVNNYINGTWYPESFTPLDTI